METLVTALGPVIVAAFAVQQLLELVDPVFFHEQVIKYKKLILGFVSLGLGLVLAFGFGLRVMAPFGVSTADWLDAIVTAILLSAGTEGSNSIMKVLQYYKESLKNGDASDGDKKKKKKS
jgi:drug/metabolite transporter (DMT)-like permease